MACTECPVWRVTGYFWESESGVWRLVLGSQMHIGGLLLSGGAPLKSSGGLDATKVEQACLCLC